MVRAELGEVLRHLALPECVVQGGIDLRRLDAKTLRRCAVDLQRDRGSGKLLVCGDITQHRKRLGFFKDFRRPLCQLRSIRVFDGILIHRAGKAAADVDVLRRLHEQLYAGDVLRLLRQPGDHLHDAVIGPLVPRLQVDIEAPVVALLPGGSGAYLRSVSRNRGVMLDDVIQFRLKLDHLLERRVLRGFRGRNDQADILGREKSLGIITNSTPVTQTVARNTIRVMKRKPQRDIQVRS